VIGYSIRETGHPLRNIMRAGIVFGGKRKRKRKRKL
jgi:hypothetical protein